MHDSSSCLHSPTDARALQVDNIEEKRGFAFVTMPHLEQAELAVSSLLLEAARTGNKKFRVEFSRRDGMKCACSWEKSYRALCLDRY